VEIDIPEVVAEVEVAFAAYEEALVTNDVAMLEALFRDDRRTIRYGIAENLYGMDAIRAFRRARSPVNLMRRIERTAITTYGRDFATPTPCSSGTARPDALAARARVGYDSLRAGGWCRPMSA
jgi:hypothetical protein